MFTEKEQKSICWRPKNTLIECIVKSKCFEAKENIEDCVADSDCHLERKNWLLCKMNAINPRYRLRGNPYDVATEDQKKIEARNERIMRRDMEEEGIWEEQMREKLAKKEKSSA
jgi:cytochrome c oxidase assembly factor 5